MIRDREGLAELLVLHGFSAGEVAEVMELLEHECPWFGEAEEVSEEIGIEMLADTLPPQVAAQVGASRLVAWHNKQARNSDESTTRAANDAYASLVRLVKEFGVEDGLGSGDFWVVEDSFSGPHAAVMVFKPLPLPIGFKDALINWLHKQSAVQTISLVNRDGDAIVEAIRE